MPSPDSFAVNSHLTLLTDNYEYEGATVPATSPDESKETTPDASQEERKINPF
jgi:hypothetical protein